MTNIASVLNTSVYVKNVKVDDYLKMTGTFIAFARSVDGVARNGSSEHRSMANKVLGTILSSMGWHSNLERTTQWLPFRALLDNPKILSKLTVQTLNQIIGSNNRSDRSMALEGSTDAPSTVATENKNVAIIKASMIKRKEEIYNPEV
jgi:hypothetical protein